MLTCKEEHNYALSISLGGTDMFCMTFPLEDALVLQKNWRARACASGFASVRQIIDKTLIIPLETTFVRNLITINEHVQ